MIDWLLKQVLGKERFEQRHTRALRKHFASKKLVLLMRDRLDAMSDEDITEALDGISNGDDSYDTDSEIRLLGGKERFRLALWAERFFRAQRRN